jgi:hypothetical protein
MAARGRRGIKFGKQCNFDLIAFGSIFLHKTGARNCFARVNREGESA